jgi:hypothetical protein
MRLYQDIRTVDSPIRGAALTTTGSTTHHPTRSALTSLQPIGALRRICRQVREGFLLLGFVLAVLALLGPVAQAQPIPITPGPNTPAGGAKPFDITGAIESFTATNIADPYSGGTMKVNGLTITIPRNLVITMPAAYLTTGQLFGGNLSSGLALTDVPAPIAAYEASIAGNIVGGNYIAGLVGIAQQGLNGANGVIKSINHVTGELCVGSSAGACNATDARVYINDPSGRYGRANGASGKPVMDTRFAVDSDNPTIHAASGYPMCIPRQTPPLIDALCPTGNRPVGVNTFVMSAAALTVPAPFIGNPIPACGALGTNNCNPNKQAPMKVGDYIGYSGILQRTALGATYVAAYAIEVNVGIFTAAGASPYYVYLDAPLIGTGPALCPGNAECQARMRTTIFMTDPSRTPALYAVDETPTGARSTRALVVPVTNTAQVGRFVFVVDKDARTLGLPGNGGVTREIAAMVAGVPNGTTVEYGDTAPPASVTANGLVFGQYVSPMGEYIFPEPNLSGEVLTPYNFRCLAFLANGWGQGGGLPNIGKLNPFPEVLTPASVNCAN